MLVRDRLREILKTKRWNQSDLARELGEHRSWVNNRITGAVDIKADELPRLASALGVDCMELLRGTECPEMQKRELSSTIGPLTDTRSRSTLELFMAGWAREYARTPEGRAAIDLLADLSRGLKEATEEEAQPDVSEQS